MIKRKLSDAIKSHLEKPEITVVTGARQVGKTTLLKLLESELKAKGISTLFLNLDIERDNAFFSSQETLLQKVHLELGEKRGIVFIDEIQRKENAGLFLKGLYDGGLSFKLIVSGSGSLELKERIHESLAGRKQIFHLAPVTFEEFLGYRTDYRYEGKTREFLETSGAQVEGLLAEYLNFGGYPKVVMASSADEKRMILEDIFQSYVLKDISYLLKVKKPDDFSRLVRVLAEQVGQIHQISELSRTLGLSQITVRDYLWVLENTFILRRLSPFHQNKRKEITKTPVVYFQDLGLRNHLLGNLGEVQKTSADGFLLQNFVANLILEKVPDANQLHHWRTKAGAEVDFVLEKGLVPVPIEVKMARLKIPEITRSLRSFIDKYHPPKAYVVNQALQTETRISETTVRFLRPSSLLVEE
ncbi:MAG: ATP-binding protein [Elusimicrobia bacterium]|nr:ATP-binding protein [Candidatus Obscuribacterium magneticum]